jgi:hypothetical protein
MQSSSNTWHVSRLHSTAHLMGEEHNDPCRLEHSLACDAAHSLDSERGNGTLGERNAVLRPRTSLPQGSARPIDDATWRLLGFYCYLAARRCGGGEPSYNTRK